MNKDKVILPFDQRIKFHLRTGMTSAGYTHAYATPDWTVAELLGCKEYLDMFKRLSFDNRDDTSKSQRRWFNLIDVKDKSLKELDYSSKDDIWFYNY